MTVGGGGGALPAGLVLLGGLLACGVVLVDVNVVWKVGLLVGYFL